MEYKPLPIGIDNFEKLVTRGYYFIDKTLLIRDLLDKKGDVNLFTRPRRFGKTLTLSMLQYFFEDMRNNEGEKTDNSGLFEGLQIMRAGEKYVSHMGQYPVISLTLKEAGQQDFEMAYYHIKSAVIDEYKRHRYLLESDMLPQDREQYELIMSGKAERDTYGEALKFLSVCLERYSGRKTIILIDEYDVPLENAYTRGFYDEMVQFIRTLFSSVLKTNSSLEFAVITGCLRISKESIFTGLNNLEVISILDKNYDGYFGFTDEEVQMICADYDMPDAYDMAKEWYNGYIFGDSNVYNPWSTVKFIKDQAASRKAFPKSYWANTSSNTIVRKLIEMADGSVKQEIEELISGGTVEKPIHEDISYDEVYKNMDNLWNFMFFTGYFRKVSERMDEYGTRYITMRIPNKEVRYIFRSKISTWFTEQVKARDMSVLYTAVVNKDVQTMEDELNDIMLHTISYMDANESYYHGILAGLLTGMPGYYVKSNREGGSGRSDLMLIPASRRKEAFVFEFKKAKDIDELEAKAEEAFAQIEEKQYKMEIRDAGYKMISMYAVAFLGKDCLVKWKG